MNTPQNADQDPRREHGDAQPGRAKPPSKSVNPARAPRWLSWRRGGLLALAILAIATVAMWPKRIQVESAAVEHGPLQVVVEEQGRTRAKHRYTVSSPITGRLLRTDLDEGDPIRIGDVLARIAPPPTDARGEASIQAEITAAQAKERAAGASRAEAQAQFMLAEGEAKRREALYTRRLISAEDRDAFAQTAKAAAARLRSATASEQAAIAESARVRTQLLGNRSEPDGEGLTEVLAPVDGRILRVIEESERVVLSGAPLFELSQSDALELVIDVLTEQAVRIRVGNPIEVSGWGGGDTLVGTVTQVEPGAFTKISALGVEEQRVNVIAELAERPAELGTEFRIEAAIVTWSGDALRVPTGALFRRDGHWQAFAIEDGIARLRTLTLGHRGKYLAEVTSGLTQGDNVIVYPTDQVEDGVRVDAKL